MPAARAALRDLRVVLRAPMALSRVGGDAGGRCRWLERPVLCVPGAGANAAVSIGADAVAFDVSAQRPMGGARDSPHAQASVCSRRPSPPLPPTRGTKRTPLSNSAKRTRNTFQQRNAKRGRPRGRGLATLQIPFPEHGSNSASNPDARSPWWGWLVEWATSMRPRESEGSRRRTTMTKGGAA